MRWMLGAAMIALAGCRAYDVDIDGSVAARAARSIDVGARGRPEPNQGSATHEPAPGRAVFGVPTASSSTDTPPLQVDKNQPDKGKVPTMLERLEFKEGILGIRVEDLKLPPFSEPQKIREEAIRKQFPPLPAPTPLPAANPGPNGQPLTLADLQQMARRTNPMIRQAHQDIQAARGNALQAGLYPNPTIGYAGSTVGQGDTNGNRSAGQQGGFAEQTFITGGKLNLARMAAERDVQIAEQKLKAAETDVQTQVRNGYFSVLAARENYRVTKGLSELIDNLYNVLLLQMLAGEVAAYEPMQIRVLAMQSRGQLVQAHNRYVFAWKQLAATLGMPPMNLTDLAGRIDMPAPQLDHESVLQQVVANHSDVIAAQLSVDKARLQARLAELQPYPDVTVHVGFQKDYTTPPFGACANINVGVPFPLWNRNQGAIQAARANWMRAMDEHTRVQNELTGKVAEAFERFENNRQLLEMYKKQMLPNQVQAFRAAVARHVAVGDKTVSYNDVVTAQQTLASVISGYLTVLSDQWRAVVDIAHLTQTLDLFQVQVMDDAAPIAEVQELFHPRPRFRR